MDENQPPARGEVRAGVRRFFRLALRKPANAQRDADDELDAFLAARIDHLSARGMNSDDARNEAVSRLGGPVDAVRAQLQHSATARERRMKWTDLLTDLGHDGRYAIRGLIARPGFTASVVLTLALGIGAATGVFSIVNGVLLRGLPYPDADRIVRVFETAPPSQGSELRSIAIPTLADWRSQLTQFDALALYGPVSFDVSGGDRPEQIDGAAASAALFSILGASPILGRTFTPEEERPGSPPVVVLSHGLWQQRYGSDSSLIGTTIRLDRAPFTVIGVMGPGFAFPPDAKIWASLAIDREYDARAARHMNGLARLAQGATLASATNELLAAEHRLAEQYPENYAERGVRLIPLAERMVGSVRPVLTLLGGAVVLVLLVACVNVANLQIARATSRQREIAIRTAIGAGRGRVARQLFAESLVLFLAAGVAGLAIAWLIVDGARSLVTGVLPRADAIQLDATVIAFSLLITMATGIVFGLTPAMRSAAVAPSAALFDGARGSTSGRSGGRLRSWLIVTETALAAMLLVGAGLLSRSMSRLSDVDPGLETRNLLTFNIAFPSAEARDPVALQTFFRDLRERLAAIPGVHGVGLASRLPLSGDDHSNGFHLEGATAATEHSAQDRAVTPGYFRSLGIRVQRGREFADSDAPTGVPVAMVNESFARRYFPGEEAVGRRITPSRAGGASREIVGVVADTRQFGLDVPAEPEFYLPHSQDPWPFLKVAVRTRSDPYLLLPSIQKAVWSLDQELPLGGVRTMDQMTAEAGAQRRLVTLVIALFAGAAYLLAAVGLYGVVAYSVTQRTAEIGIRLALGARRSEIGRMVISRGVLLAGVGGLVGLAAALPLTRWLRGMLFGVSQTDPLTFVAVALLVPAVAVLASLMPARRALRIDPTVAMRGE